MTKRGITILFAVLALWLGTVLHAAPPDVPAAGHGRYVVVLWRPGTLLPGQKHGDEPKKLAEPDLAKFDAKLLSRHDNELVVDLPPHKARELRRHEAVMYVQRIWMGEDTAGWNESHPRNRFEAVSQSDTDLTWEAAYTYDAAGNIKTIGDHAFEYDGVDRVLSDKVGNTTIESYAYDAFGNRTSVTAGGTTIQTPASVSTNRLANAVYDAAGNVTQNGNALFAYDSLNMMVEAQGTGVTPRRFLYDADDERLGWMATGLNRWTVRDFAGRTLREFKSDSLTHPWQWQHDYIYADGALVAGEQQEWGYEGTPEYRYGGDRHYHLDHLGSVRIVSNEQGRSVAEYSFAPFGVEQNQAYQEHPWHNPNAVDPMRFAGHARDYYGASSEYGGGHVDYMHARYYGAGVGRFLSVDPVLAVKRAMYHPQGWNRYSYAQNNPINRIDPDGRLDGNSDDFARQLFPDDRAAQVAFDQQVAAGTAQLSAALLVALVPGPDDIALGWLGATRGMRVAARFFSRGGADDLPTAGSIRNVNPTGGTQNCVNCAIATDATLAGRPASALPGIATPISALETTFGARFTSMSSQGAIQEAMAKAGSGARGIVYIGPRGGGTGHVFNVVNQGGVVRFLDGQSGKPAKFEKDWTDIRLLRTN